MNKHQTIKTDTKEAGLISNQEVVQAKLAIGAVNDPLEKEADDMADRVIRMPEDGLIQRKYNGDEDEGKIQQKPGSTFIQRKCADCEEEEKLQRKPLTPFIQKKSTSGGIVASESVSNQINATQGKGQSLPKNTKSFMESRFASDFSDVNVHTNSTAIQMSKDLGAKAFTVGKDIYFNQGQFSPGTDGGKRLLAHELTHVGQQNNTSNNIIQSNKDSSSTSNISSDPDKAPAPSKEEKLTQGIGAVDGRVKKIRIAIDNRLIIFETSKAKFLYELRNLSIPIGEYKAKVSIKKNNVNLDLINVDGEQGTFTYKIYKNQDSPVSLLKGQEEVSIEVVQVTNIDTTTELVKCLMPLSDTVLIRKKQFQRPLFNEKKKDYKWSIGRIPLGFLGWIDAEVNAGVSLAGLLSLGWQDAILSDICLFQVLGNDQYGGSAKFDFKAALVPSFNAKGSLKVSANYLGALSLVSLEGKLEGSAIGKLLGAIESRVDLVYDKKKNKWSFNSEALLYSEVGMKITAQASAAIELLYKEVWSKKWPLVDADFGFGWQGGLKVGRDTKPSIVFGNIDMLSSSSKSNTSQSGSFLPTASASNPIGANAPRQANVNPKAILSSAFNANSGSPAQTPQGLTDKDPLPIVWYKPLNIYPRVIEIPRAISPNELNRDDGPTKVHYKYGRGSVFEDIGVGKDLITGQSNWPKKRQGSTPGKIFSFVEKTVGDKVKDRLRDRIFKDKLLSEGTSLGSMGLDVDHVHEKQFGGQDALPNLWPANSSANQRAGGCHDLQLNEYRATLGNIAGRWFEIVDIRNP